MSLFIKKYIILTSNWVIASTLTFNLFLQQYLSPTVYFVPLVFAIISLLVIKMILKQKEKKLTKFSSAFMLTNMAKLFLYLIFFVILYLNSDTEKRTAFAIYYMLTYLIYAIADTTSLLNIFKEEK